MLATNLKLALRHLSKHRTYAAINIFGLATAIAACLLVWRVLRYELSYNQNFANHDRTGRILLHTTGPEGLDDRSRGLPIPAMRELEAQFDQFEATSRLHEDWPVITVPNPAGGAPLRKTDAEMGEIGFFAEPGFLKIFDLHWLAGGGPGALDETGSIVLSRGAAEKLFGSDPASAIGQTVLLYNKVPAVVRGVFAELPKNCDMPLFELTSYATLQKWADEFNYRQEEWGAISSNDQFVFLLKEKSQFASLAAPLAEVGKGPLNDGNNKARGRTAQLEMQPLGEWHFDERIGTSTASPVSRARLLALGAIGLMVLALACFNFVNLATALAATRAREVGVRKAVGGRRGELVGQFMAEAGVVVAFSVAAGCVLAKGFAPLLKKISDVPDSQPFFSDPLVWPFLAATGLAVTLLAGLWPSVVLARTPPVLALKNQPGSGDGRGFSLKKGLVVAQFAIAQALLIGAVVTVAQLDFLRKMDTGFSKALILSAPFNGDSTSLAQLPFLRKSLTDIPSVELVSFSSDVPSSGSTWASNFAFGRGSDEPFSTTMKLTDADYQQVFGLKMAAGRWFAPSDTVREYVVNEALLKKVGIASAEAAIGQELRVGGGRFLPVCGVVKDFHAHSAHARSRTVEPLTIGPKQKFYSNVSVKLRPGDLAGSVAAVGRAFDTAFPEQIFDGRFFDEQIAEFYAKEEQFSRFCRAVALLAALIGGLGLFGLASHTAARRVKEIGVRKVLGASVGSLTGLLTRDFLKLVLLASAVAAPVAVFFMKKWLSDFAYRIDIEWWMVALVAVAAVGVAFASVGFLSVRAAMADPVRSLRSE